MNVKKLLGGTFSVLFAITITILSWRFYVHFLNLYDVSRLIIFCAIDFILDAVKNANYKKQMFETVVQTFV